LAEKAYAQWNQTGKEGRDDQNAYASIQGGWMATVDAQVLGYNATDYIMTTTSKQVAISALAAKEAVTIGTISSSNNADTLPYGLYGSHAYAITGYNASTDTFTLYNPWGFDQPSQLTWSELQANTTQLAVASTSGTVPISSSVVKSTAGQITVHAAVLPAATPADIPLAAFAGQSPSESGLLSDAPAAAGSAVLAPATTGGSSSSAAADATRTLFGRFGTDSGASTFTEQHGDGQASDRLAFSVDELFGDTSSGVAVCDFA
jgi:hypothetical protein